MTGTIPDWLDPSAWLHLAVDADADAVRRALRASAPAEHDLAVLLSAAAGEQMEALARRAQALTRRHFGRTISLYAPLYLSSYCSSGCVYCGFASDVNTPRRRLTPREADAEMEALKAMGLEEILLLTGERMSAEDFGCLRECLRLGAARFHRVTIEVFPMSRAEYGDLVHLGCTGVTLYQETYDPDRYERLHRWGPKRDYAGRLDGPVRALAAGVRTVGVGALLGLSDPVFDMIGLYRHVVHLRRTFWKSGVSVSFPRIRPQAGGYVPEFPVTERRLAQIIFAFRICLPDVPLVLSTRERPAFRDGMAGVGISKMSVASRTTVGGYSGRSTQDTRQFDVSDGRDVEGFCAMLRGRNLEPVFKNWDMVYSETAVARGERSWP